MAMHNQKTHKGKLENVTKIIPLLLQGLEAKEMANELHLGLRTTKSYLNTLFKQYKIKSGNKKVKLAVLLYRKELCRG